MIKLKYIAILRKLLSYLQSYRSEQTWTSKETQHKHKSNELNLQLKHPTLDMKAHMQPTLIKII